MRSFIEKSIKPSQNITSNNFFGASAEAPFFSPATIQPKLTIGQPNDKYEQEADAMADRVMQMGSNINYGNSQGNHPSLQTKCSACAGEEGLQPKLDIQKMEEEEEPVQPKLDIQKMEEEEEAVQPKLAIQKMGEEEEMLNTKPAIMKAGSEKNVASDNLSSKLSQTRGGGRSLSASTNALMSNAFGTNFSHVNIHTGGDAVQMNQQLGAKAFTHGSDIYFNKGEYNPDSSTGKHLLAHELTHVVQQNGTN